MPREIPYMEIASICQRMLVESGGCCDHPRVMASVNSDTLQCSFCGFTVLYGAERHLSMRNLVDVIRGRVQVHREMRGRGDYSVAEIPPRAFPFERLAGVGTDGFVGIDPGMLAPPRPEEVFAAAVEHSRGARRTRRPKVREGAPKYQLKDFLRSSTGVIFEVRRILYLLNEDDMLIYYYADFGGQYRKESEVTLITKREERTDEVEERRQSRRVDSRIVSRTPNTGVLSTN